MKTDQKELNLQEEKRFQKDIKDSCIATALTFEPDNIEELIDIAKKLYTFYE